MSHRTNKRIYLDSSVYIASLKGETDLAAGGLTRAELTYLLFEAAGQGRITVFTSTVTIVEVRRGIDSSSLSIRERYRLIDGLFERSSTRFVELDRDVALSARLIASRYGIKTMDAIQVASAEMAICGEMFIWDNRIVTKFSSTPMDGLSVCEPYWEGQMHLN